MRRDNALARAWQALPLYIPVILLGAVGIAITIFDAVFMAKGAAAMAPGTHEGHLLAGVAICAAVFKAGWLAAFRTFLLRRHILLALAVLSFGLLTHLFSITATIGVAATGRDAVISERAEAKARHDRALAAYRDAKLRKAAMPGTRPVAAIQGDLRAIEAEIDDYARREAAERKTGCGNRCQKATRKGEAAKARRSRLETELATAVEARKADADLARAEAALKAADAPGRKDPRAAALASYVPASAFGEREAALLMPSLPSLIVEIGGPVAFLMAGAFLGLARERRQDAGENAALTVAVAEPVPTTPAGQDAPRRLPAPEKPARKGKAKPASIVTASELAAIRAALGESQAAFAARLGVNVRTLRRWETGERDVGRQAALRARVIADGMRQPCVRAVA